MPNSSNGLRFDVYERVHLSEDVAAIGELDEIELTPHIQVINHGEQIMLRGNLLLTGVYDGQEEAGSKHTLEHLIPVEITLPLNRVHRVEDISVEIDNFDVDILSSKTLNITGVLSLRGLQIEQAGALPDSSVWGEEPITVVHRIEQTPQEAFHPDRQQEIAWGEPQPEWGAEILQAGNNEQALETEDEEAGTEAVTQQPVPASNKASEPLVAAPLQRFEPSIVRTERLRETPSQHHHQPPETSYASPVTWSGLPSEDERQSQNEPLEAAYKPSDTDVEELILQAAEPSLATSQRESDLVQPQSEPESSDHDLAAQAKPAELTAQLDDSAADTAEPVTLSEAQPVAEVTKTEMKIAFSGKEGKSNSFGLSSLLQSNKREQEAKALAKQQEAKHLEEEALEKRIEAGEDVEWKKLFLSKQGEEREFRKVRICIVQREETLETIAGRYQLNPREIVLYNRLPDQSINEGQVLYIPQVQ